MYIADVEVEGTESDTNVFGYQEYPCQGTPSPTNTKMSVSDGGGNNFPGPETMQLFHHLTEVSRLHFIINWQSIIMLLCTLPEFENYLDYMFACNTMTGLDHTLTSSMDNYLVMQPMVNLR